MIELAEVICRHGPEYRARFGARLPPAHGRALRALERCRTPALGGHYYQCTECAQPHFGFHSCNHRSCPKCGGADAQAWRERQQRDLLPVPYFLVTFTVPEELRALRALVVVAAHGRSAAALQRATPGHGPEAGAPQSAPDTPAHGGRLPRPVRSSATEY